MKSFRVSPSQRDIFNKMLEFDDLAVFIHRSPDGDSLGSGAALIHVLRNMGKTAQLVCSDEVPDRLSFITDGQKKLELDHEPGTIVSVDVATKGLFGDKYFSYSDKVDFCIDHHYTNTLYAAHNIVMPRASSAGEVLYRLFLSAGIPVDDYMAEKLYCAVTSDTGCFRYNNVTPAVHRMAADLVAHGLNTAWINRRIFEMASIERLRLESRVAELTELYENGRVAVSYLSNEDMKLLNADENDTDGLVNIPRRIDSVMLSAFIRQMSDGTIRASLRSECDLDVAEIAAEFGGGGHARAAGCTLGSDMAAARLGMEEALRREWRKYIDNHSR